MNLDRAVIQLDTERSLRFDANAMVAFEERTGQHFLSFQAAMEDAIREAMEKYPDPPGKAGKEAVQQAASRRSTAIARSISLRDFTTLVWCGLVCYDNGNPEWPLAITEVRRHISMPWVVENFRTVLEAMLRQQPSKDEVPRAFKNRPRIPIIDEKSSADDGGASSGLPQEEILDSLTLKQAG